MTMEKDDDDPLEKYQRQEEGDFEDEVIPFEDQVFCTGMINDADDFDLKVKTFPANISDDDLNAWLREKRGDKMISRSIKDRDFFGGESGKEWMRVWYYEAI